MRVTNKEEDDDERGGVSIFKWNIHIFHYGTTFLIEKATKNPAKWNDWNNKSGLWWITSENKQYIFLIQCSHNVYHKTDPSPNWANCYISHNRTMFSFSLSELQLAPRWTFTEVHYVDITSVLTLCRVKRDSYDTRSVYSFTSSGFCFDSSQLTVVRLFFSKQQQKIQCNRVNKPICLNFHWLTCKLVFRVFLMVWAAMQTWTRGWEAFLSRNSQLRGIFLGFYPKRRLHKITSSDLEMLNVMLCNISVQELTGLCGKFLWFKGI